jgi:hypothetical protein
MLKELTEIDLEIENDDAVYAVHILCVIKT